ncbi:MAG: acetyl-CoA C-acyltransferase [Chlorobi bacterium]|nr:acetyl-CoA C-acyltransferase [Chlorobiota bacterium]
MDNKDIFIVGAARTPLGSFGSSLASFSGVKLGAISIKAALERSGLTPDQVDEVYMGNVMSANLGQAPARQASLGAGIPDNVPCTTVNKVCSSGMKAVMIGTQTIKTGDNQIVVSGGMESMSNVPYYLDRARFGMKMGHGQVIDGMIKDGLWDVYNDYHMGNAGELCARELKISREEQDEYAIASYKRAAEATGKGWYKDEIVPVSVPQRKGDPLVVDKDEEFTRVKFEKITSLRPVFDREGTITAANASTINDGASATVLASADAVKKNNLKPLARIITYADAAQAPEWFTTAPVLAIEKALQKAGLTLKDIDFFEINEAFAVVVLAAMKKLSLSHEKVNVHGGAVALGHPLGMSGNRIIVTLMHVLKHHNGRYGIAALCNGGGGASAVVIENLM